MGHADSDGNSALGCLHSGCIHKAHSELANFKVNISLGDLIGAGAFAFLTGSGTL